MVFSICWAGLYQLPFWPVISRCEAHSDSSHEQVRITCDDEKRLPGQTSLMINGCGIIRNKKNDKRRMRFKRSESSKKKKKCLIMVVMFIFHYHVNLVKLNLWTKPVVKINIWQWIISNYQSWHPHLITTGVTVSLYWKKPKHCLMQFALEINTCRTNSIGIAQWTSISSIVFPIKNIT